ncbi:21780_t:CDS:2, partial [Rhizophagus irregularis]
GAAVKARKVGRDTDVQRQIKAKIFSIFLRLPVIRKSIMLKFSDKRREFCGYWNIG